MDRLKKIGQQLVGVAIATAPVRAPIVGPQIPSGVGKTLTVIGSIIALLTHSPLQPKQ